MPSGDCYGGSKSPRPLLLTESEGLHGRVAAVECPPDGLEMGLDHPPKATVRLDLAPGGHRQQLNTASSVMTRP
jgi:hypothetical protein